MIRLDPFAVGMDPGLPPGGAFRDRSRADEIETDAVPQRDPSADRRFGGPASRQPRAIVRSSDFGKGTLCSRRVVVAIDFDVAMNVVRKKARLPRTIPLTAEPREHLRNQVLPSEQERRKN